MKLKTAWIVDYADNRGDRQRKHFQTRKLPTRSASTLKANAVGRLSSRSGQGDGQDRPAHSSSNIARDAIDATSV